MILIQLPNSGWWAFRDAELIRPVGGVYTHQTRQDAVSRAEQAGLAVDAEGHVTPLQTGTGGL